MFKVNNINTRKHRHWPCFGAFRVNFKHNIHLLVVFLFLTLSRYIFAGFVFFFLKSDSHLAKDLFLFASMKVLKWWKAFFILNPYSLNVTFLYPLKTSENLWFSDVFRGCRNVTLGEYGLTYLNYCPDFFDHVGKGLDKKANVNLNLWRHSLDSK